MVTSIVLECGQNVSRSVSVALTFQIVFNTHTLLMTLAAYLKSSYDIVSCLGFHLMFGNTADSVLKSFTHGNWRTDISGIPVGY
jgi:hypothetical protein